MTTVGLVWTLALFCSASALTCDEARMKCAYRSGCAQALHSYMMDCADVLAGRSSRCPWPCKRALIALASTEVGVALADCECGDSDFCRLSKERAEVCRPEVTLATAEDTVVPCSVAEWICAADHLCSTALDYYHRLCKSMFHGRKCTHRCNNSLAILDRQPKAGKLRNCFCDGTEDFPCSSIKKNTQRLCYGREDWEEEEQNFVPTRTKVDSGSAMLSSSGLLCIFLICLGSWINVSLCQTNMKISVRTRLPKYPHYKIQKHSWNKLLTCVYHSVHVLLKIFAVSAKILMYSFQFGRNGISSTVSNWRTSKNFQTLCTANELQAYLWFPPFECWMSMIWPWWWTSERERSVN